MKTTYLAKMAPVLIWFAGCTHLAVADDVGGNALKDKTTTELAAANARLIAQCADMPTPANATELPVHITTWGTKGPTVFFVHGGVQGGLGGGPETFAEQRQLADEGWQLKLIDRPGFGKSPSRGPDDMNADAKLIADSLGNGAHLIGHSWGGAEALLAAARRPDAIRSLILIEPAIHPILQTDPASMQDPEVRRGFQMIARLTLESPTPAAFATSFSKTLGSSNPSAEALDAHPEGASALGCALLRGRRASAAEMRSAADTVTRAGIPVLIISGGYSVRQDETDEVLARLMHGQHVVIHSPNHFIQQESAPEFNQAIVAFMRDADRRDHSPK